VLVDVIMPGMDGFQTLDEIKNIDPKTNIIIMSVYNREGFIEKADSERAFARIAKPFDIEELLQLIIRAIENQRKID
jgi:DNA-binding NtrC family response regulator